MLELQFDANNLTFDISFYGSSIFAALILNLKVNTRYSYFVKLLHKFYSILEECGLQGDRKLAVNGNVSG